MYYYKKSEFDNKNITRVTKYLFLIKNMITIMIKNSTIDSSRILIFRFDTFQFQSAPYITITHSTRIWTEVSSIFLTTLNKNFDDLCLHNIGFFLFTHITLKNSMEKLGHPVYMYVGNSKQLGIRTLWTLVYPGQSWSK